MTATRCDEAALRDARELLEKAARYVELKAARDELELQVVRLARRLTRDATLTDGEAVRTAGEAALRLLRETASGKEAARGG